MGGIVLAGRANRGALRQAAPESLYEAEIDVAGRPMAAWVAAALAAVPGVRHLAVVGPPGLWPGALVVSPRDSLASNLRAGLDALGDGDEAVLIAAGDAPLLTARAAGDLAAAAVAAGAQFGYPIVSRQACEAAFPGVRRTYVRMADGSFSGGNCFYLRRDAVETALALVSRLYAARKQPLRLARILGLSAVLGLLTGRARIADLERTAEVRFGLRARAFPSADAGLAVDVDRPEDLDLARAALARDGGGGAG
jgi:2-phospho-L-lactate guanylyltransferase (CobY/MobA/RfbA family)